MYLNVFIKEKSHVIHLTGIAHGQTMYVEGDDPLDVNIESLAIDAKDIRDHGGYKIMFDFTFNHK